MTTTTYTLAGRELTLAAPASYATCTDIMDADARNPRRATMAALGVCARGPGRPPIRYDAHDYNPLAYGGAVLDWLHGQGVPEKEAFKIGEVARDLVWSAFIPAKALEKARGNDGAGEGSTG